MDGGTGAFRPVAMAPRRPGSGRDDLQRQRDQDRHRERQRRDRPADDAGLHPHRRGGLNGTAVFVDEPTTLDETFTTGDPANYTSTLTCLYGPDDTPITVAADGSFTTPAAAKDTTIRCEFTNTRNSATLTLEKEWVDGEAGDSARLIINGANGATATTTGGNQVSTEKATATVYAGDTVGLAESLTTPSGASYQSSLACDGQTITAIGTSGTYTVPADPDAVTCRFTNTPRSWLDHDRQGRHEHGRRLRCKRLRFHRHRRHRRFHARRRRSLAWESRRSRSATC